MSHTTIDNAADTVAIQAVAVVSKVVYRDDEFDFTVFGVLSGRLRCTVESDETRVVPGTWLHMSPGTPHSPVAEEPTVMLLTLIHGRF